MKSNYVRNLVISLLPDRGKREGEEVGTNFNRRRREEEGRSLPFFLCRFLRIWISRLRRRKRKRRRRRRRRPRREIVTQCSSFSLLLILFLRLSFPLYPSCMHEKRGAGKLIQLLSRRKFKINTQQLLAFKA